MSDWRNSPIWFQATLIAPRGGVKVTRAERSALRENATKVPFQDRWVFEGAWDTVVSRDRFKAIGGGSVPSLGGLKTDALLEIINECFACHFRRPL